MIDERLIQNWFTYHPPTSDEVTVYETIRAHAREFAHILNNLVPDGADKSDAMRKLRECVMTANAGIATAPGMASVHEAYTEKARDAYATARKTSTPVANPRAQTAMWPTPATELPIVPKTLTTSVSGTTSRRRSGPPTMDDLVSDFVANR